jgi:glycosyltransferase involved in cell wall biosynthesis
MPSITALLPAYNEEISIGSVVLRTKQYADRVIVIDDGSSDRTAEVAALVGAKHPMSISDAYCRPETRRMMSYRLGVCLDSSVVVKWFKVEEESAEALKIRRWAEERRIKLTISACNSCCNCYVDRI